MGYISPSPIYEVCCCGHHLYQFLQVGQNSKDLAELLSRTSHLDSSKHLMVADLMQRLPSTERFETKKMGMGKKTEKSVFSVDLANTIKINPGF